MKNEDEVVAAFEVLWRNAETDFEKHRIKSLLRDLAYAPPEPEIIDDTHQKFNGVVFHRTKSGHYVSTYILHRAVYEYYNGELSSDYAIHHKDFNKANNNIENLMPLTNSEHRALHNSIEHNTKFFICEKCGKSFEDISCLKNKICQDCRRRTCLNCGKEYIPSATKMNLKFCSLKCNHEYNLKMHYEVRKCVICGKEFSQIKSSPQVCCSNSCAKKLQWQKRKIFTKTCERCGKTFQTPYKRTKYCGKSCLNAVSKKRVAERKAKLLSQGVPTQKSLFRNVF